MGKLVAGRLKDSLDSYTTGEIEQAMAVWQNDGEVDGQYDSLFRELLTYMIGDPRMIGAYATNIAEIVHYEVTGEEIVGDRPKWVAPDASGVSMDTEL